MAGASEQIACQEPALANQDTAGIREERFAGIVNRHARFVFRVAYSVLRSVQDAEDVVQETFLKVYRSPRWEQIADERAFLARTAWRIAVDHRKGKPAPGVADEAEWEGCDPEEAAIASNSNQVVHRLIDGLPEELRQPLALSSFEEFSSKQIAEVMGIPEGTVRTRLMRARQILREKLMAAMRGRP
ncbi:MAG: RNA polymerase sigma factor [Bryobacterales bacterium]|nr:RNA polymerase sigma factor [Bryobacterales bacterium]